MMRRSFLVVFPAAVALGLLAFGLALAQEPAAPKDEVLDALDARVRPFLEAVSQGDTQKAYDDLLRGSPLLLKKAEAVKALVERTNQLPSRFGRYRNFERIDVKRVGKDLVLLKYLYKCEDFPVVWYFTFYRPPAGTEAPAEEAAWRVIIVRFDTELELLGL
jgi:hypothetical protein